MLSDTIIQFVMILLRSLFATKKIKTFYFGPLNSRLPNAPTHSVRLPLLNFISHF